jgi:hypothetical protein
MSNGSLLLFAAAASSREQGASQQARSSVFVCFLFYLSHDFKNHLLPLYKKINIFDVFVLMMSYKKQREQM